MTEYEFDQILAEAKEKLRIDTVLPLLETAASLFGWPIPEEFREAVALPVCLLVKDKAQ